MDTDRSILGEGPYPVTGPLAVLARVAFLGALLAIVVAAYLPSSMVPQFVRSRYLQHFAAFYVAALFGLAASPRAPVLTIAVRIFAFATILEALHLLAGARLKPLIDNWVADLGGMAAAFAPIAVARFRRRFLPPKPVADAASGD